MSKKNLLILGAVLIIVFVGVLYFEKMSKKTQRAKNEAVYSNDDNALCVDSDNGKEIFTKGQAETRADEYLENAGEIIHINSDSCAEIVESGELSGLYKVGLDACSGENCYIAEAFCGEDEDYPDMGLHDMREFIQCPNGCNDGACILE